MNCSNGGPEMIGDNEQGVSDRRTFMKQALCFGGTALVAGPAALISSTVAHAGGLIKPRNITSLISQGLDKPEVMREFRAMIKEELKAVYANPPEGWPPYDPSKIDSDAEFFGSVRGNASNQIEYDRTFGTLYDNRIKGSIDIRTPEPILALIDNRVVEREQSGDIAFIMKGAKGTDIFVYYEGGRLKYLFPTTVGEGDDTPDNMVVSGGTNANGRKVNDRKLANYYNINGAKGPMAYSRRFTTLQENGTEVYEGINTHIGSVARGNSSHGCARQGGFGAAILYHLMKKGTIVYYRPDTKLLPRKKG